MEPCYPYTDFGPARVTRRIGTAGGVLHADLASGRYLDRPYCDLCGPFRGRYLRRSGESYGIPDWRCRACDREGER